MARFNARPAGELKKALIRIGENDQKWLRLLAGSKSPSDPQIPGAIHLLLQLVNLRVSVARESAEIPPAAASADVLEQALLLIAHDCGLLTDEEFARGLHAAHLLHGSDTMTRIGGIAMLINERMQMLEDTWAEQRKVAEQAWERWNAQEAVKERAAQQAAVTN